MLGCLAEQNYGFHFKNRKNLLFLLPIMKLNRVIFRYLLVLPLLIGMALSPVHSKQAPRPVATKDHKSKDSNLPESTVVAQSYCQSMQQASIDFPSDLSFSLPTIPSFQWNSDVAMPSKLPLRSTWLQVMFRHYISTLAP